MFQCCNGLGGAVSRRGTANDLRRPVQVIAHREFRAGTRFKSRQGGERHHVTRSISDVELSDVLRATIGALSLHIHLPLTAEAVEVIDERASHECLDSPINILYVDTLLQYFVAIDGDELLGHARQKCGIDRCEFRTLSGRGQELVQIFGKERHVVTRAILQNKREASRSSHARNCWRRKREGNALRQSSQFPVYALPYELILLFSFLPVFPFF